MQVLSHSTTSPKQRCADSEPWTFFCGHLQFFTDIDIELSETVDMDMDTCVTQVLSIGLIHIFVKIRMEPTTYW